ncbi:MAG: ankyrin repeat domain-containing protein [candidate division WS1 bacterium]|nr:ankyrin repeat domain-containing protein [candidate division WS1 bacterium]
MDCPKCGYAMRDFDVECPMCKRLGVMAKEVVEIHEAARQGNMVELKALLHRGADVNAEDILGWTPLHRAAAEGHTATCALLLDRGKADVNAKSSEGWTPLASAVVNDRTATANLLRRHGGVW